MNSRERQEILNSKPAKRIIMYMFSRLTAAMEGEKDKEMEEFLKLAEEMKGLLSPDEIACIDLLEENIIQPLLRGALPVKGAYGF